MKSRIQVQGRTQPPLGPAGNFRDEVTVGWEMPCMHERVGICAGDGNYIPAFLPPAGWQIYFAINFKKQRWASVIPPIHYESRWRMLFETHSSEPSIESTQPRALINHFLHSQTVTRCYVPGIAWGAGGQRLIVIMGAVAACASIVHMTCKPCFFNLHMTPVEN